MLFYSLVKHWLGQKVSDGVQDILEAKYNRAASGNYHWLTAEYAQALAYFADEQSDRTKYQQQANDLHKKCHTSTCG